MANVTLEKPELFILREAVLKKYCKTINESWSDYAKKLTGTISNYEAITSKIEEYLEDEKHIKDYLEALEESSFKPELQKYVKGITDKNNRIKFETATADTLRKLLFNSLKEEKQRFREFSVYSFYVYTGLDRGKVLKSLPPKEYSEGTITADDAGYLQDSGASTITPFTKAKKCILTPIDKYGNKEKPIELKFDGSPVTLNRQNLDKENNTITSKIQAMLSVTDNEWIIDNKSELESTYLRILKPLKLQKGDVILFGNKHFLFDE